MNEQVLSFERMQYLKALGVDTSKASMVRIYTTNDGEVIDFEYLIHTDERCIENDGSEYMYYDADYQECWKGAKEEILDAETGNYDHSYRKKCSCFTVQDMIDILPNKLFTNLTLNLKRIDGKWFCQYVDKEIVRHSFEADKLLSAVYAMLCLIEELKQ